MFMPGPTPVAEDILRMGSWQPPYNRTQSFSELTLEILEGLKALFNTRGEVVILTASGTGAMEAAAKGCLLPEGRALIVNGGVWGQRWVDICRANGLPFEEIQLASGTTVDPGDIEARLMGGSFDALLINGHETSTGVLYDLPAIGEIARRYNALFIVDAISTVGADEFQMDDWGIDVAILSSQKALALPPGLSFVALNQRALDRLDSAPSSGIYFDLKIYLKNQARGQMPYTPAISLFLMLHERLNQMRRAGLDQGIEQHAQLAKYFRDQLPDLLLQVFSLRPSNAMTAVRCANGINARELVRILETQHSIYVAPNSGELETRVFRVSHMGDQHEEDVDGLCIALRSTINSLRPVHEMSQ